MFKKGVNELTLNENIDKAYFYLQKAFQFTLVRIHEYPNYISQPIQIWRENNSILQDTVNYFGNDLYILENLIVWAGEFHKIYKK